MQQKSTWHLEDSLTFWYNHSYSKASRRFAEQLDSRGDADFSSDLRMRVPLRQIYAFTFCLRHGLTWSGTNTVNVNITDIESRFNHFWDTTWCIGKPGFPTLTNSQNHIVNAQCLTYDHAFALLALSQLIALSKNPKALYAKLEMLWDFLCEEFEHTEIGFRSQRREQPVLEQNPNMHMFEACLALWETTKNNIFIEKAETILQLFQQTFLDKNRYFIYEFFDTNWKPLTSEKQSIEPGHMLEWVALLNQYERLTNKNSGIDLVRLFEITLDFGQRPDGLICNRLNSHGSQVDSKARCWPQTELIRASLAVQKQGYTPSPLSKSETALARLEQYYLGQPLPWGWRDSIDEYGNALNGPIPASTLYHIVNAFIELRAT